MPTVKLVDENTTNPRIRAVFDDRFAGRIGVGYAFQEVGDLPAGFAAPAGRVKPWGTGHAVWCARHAVSEIMRPAGSTKRPAQAPMVR